MLAEKTPAGFVAFDLLALGDESFLDRPFSERRAALVEALGRPRRHGPCFLTRTTEDPAEAERWFEEFEGAGLDGVIAKPLGCGVRAERAHHAQDQARAHGRRRRRRLPRAQDLDAGEAAARLPAARAVRATASCSTSASAPASPPRGAPSCSRSCSRWSATSTTTRGAGGTSSSTANPDRVPGTQSRWSAGKDLGVHAAAPRAGAGGEVRPHGGPAVPAHRPLQAVAPRPRPGVAAATSQLEEPVGYDLARVLSTEPGGEQ